MPRNEKRGIVWEEMGRLQSLGLGTREMVSEQRDRFNLADAHPATARLVSKAGRGSSGLMWAASFSVMPRLSSNRWSRQISVRVP